MNSNRRTSLFALLTGVLAALALASGPTWAADAPREVSVNLNAGESYVIKGLSKDGTPAVHVVNNPNALIVHGEVPGELVVLGTSAGEWSIKVKTESGEQVKYNISVKAIASPFDNPLAPGKTPPPMGSPKFGSSDSSSSTGSATAALDAGAGPVTPSTSKPSTDSASAAVSASTAGSSAGATTAALVNDPPPPAATSSSGSNAKAPEVVAENSASPAPASFASSSSSASPLTPVAAPATSASAPVAPPADASSAQPVIPSQSMASQMPPIERFREDPMSVPTSPSESGASGTNFLPDDVVLLAAGSSRIYDFPRRIRRISISDTEVADLQVINPYQINLIGHKTGFTTLAVWDTQGRYEERQIRVDPYGKQQVMLNVIVAELNRNRLEQQGVNWTASLPKIGISLTGIGPAGVATPYSASTNLTSSEIFNTSAGPVTLNSTANGTLPGAGQLIPLLLSPAVNYGIAAGNSSLQTQTLFNFLEQHNLAKILAEPHLLANSGEKAEFLSGGEIPIVVAQALNTSIVFKQFGTSVIFVPTVVGRDEVELEVKPEVSQPDYAHGVNLYGFTVPAFVTRRAQTFVRLNNNQTLIIAGLILHTKTSEVDKTPYLGDVPFLGVMFKHTSFQDQETDLVMSVTPQLVQALPHNGTVALPTDRGPLTGEEIRTERLTVPDASRPRF